MYNLLEIIIQQIEKHQSAKRYNRDIQNVLFENCLEEKCFWHNCDFMLWRLMVIFKFKNSSVQSDEFFY